MNMSYKIQLTYMTFFIRILIYGVIKVFYLFFKDLFVYFRERESMVGRGRGRGREKESQKDSLLSVEPNMGLDPTTLRS